MSRCRGRVVRISLLAVSFAVLAGGAVLGLQHRLGPAFEATASWTVDPIVAVADPELVDYRLAATRSELLLRAWRALGVPAASAEEVEELGDSVALSAVTEPTGTLVLRLRSSATTPWAAARRAAALAAALEGWDRDTAGARLAQAAADLEQRAEALAERVRALQVLGNAEAAGEVEALVAERAVLVDLGAGVAERVSVAAVEGTLRREDGIGWSIAPRAVGAMALAGALAAVLGAGLGWLVSRDRGEPAADARKPSFAGLGVLADFPRGLTDDASEVRDAAAKLRTELLSLTRGRRPRVFLVTSAFEMEGKTTVARLLAEELAWHGLRTLLVDADLVAPSLAQRYGATESSSAGGETLPVPTTLEWLQNPEIAPNVVSITLEGEQTVDLIPQYRATRPAPGTAQELFAGLGDALLRWAGYEAIVIDSPALLSVGDTRLMAPFATGVVVVVDPGRTGRRTLAEVRRVLRGAGVTLLGVVSNQLTIGEPEPQ